MVYWKKVTEVASRVTSSLLSFGSSNTNSSRPHDKLKQELNSIENSPKRNSRGRSPIENAEDKHSSSQILHHERHSGSSLSKFHSSRRHKIPEGHGKQAIDPSLHARNDHKLSPQQSDDPLSTDEKPTTEPAAVLFHGGPGSFSKLSSSQSPSKVTHEAADASNSCDIADYGQESHSSGIANRLAISHPQHYTTDSTIHDGTHGDHHESKGQLTQMEKNQAFTQELARKAAKLELEVKALSGKVTLYKNKADELSSRNKEISHHLKVSEQERDDANKQIREQERQMQSIYQHYRALKDENESLKDKLWTEETRCASLMSDIAQISHLKPKSSKDDHYFESLFNTSFLSLQDWILSYFFSVNISDGALSSLNSSARERFTCVAGNDWMKIMQEEHFYIVQAFIMEEVRQSLLEPFLFNIQESAYYDKILKSFNGTDEEIVTWRIWTVNMMTLHADFCQKTKAKVEQVATQILDELTPLEPGGKPAPRLKKLKAILENIAHCAIECQKEPSTFRFITYKKDEVFKSSFMIDAEGAIDPKELEAGEARVQLTVTPAVIRDSYQQRSTELVILPAKVRFQKFHGDDKETETDIVTPPEEPDSGSDEGTEMGVNSNDIPLFQPGDERHVTHVTAIQLKDGMDQLSNAQNDENVSDGAGLASKYRESTNPDDGNTISLQSMQCNEQSSGSKDCEEILSGNNTNGIIADGPQNCEQTKGTATDILPTDISQSAPNILEGGVGYSQLGQAPLHMSNSSPIGGQDDHNFGGRYGTDAQDENFAHRNHGQQYDMVGNTLLTEDSNSGQTIVHAVPATSGIGMDYTEPPEVNMPDAPPQDSLDTEMGGMVDAETESMAGL